MGEEQLQKKNAQEPGKKEAGKLFLEEVSKSSTTVIVLAIISGLILGGILVALTTESVYTAPTFGEGLRIALQAIWKTYESLFVGSIGSPSRIVAALQSGDASLIRRAFNPFFESLVATTPLLFAGLAVALGFRVGLFNIGAEGQIFIGALGAVTAGIFLTGLPRIIHVPLSLLAGALAGGLWGFIPGLLKAKTGAHEVINSIMMNYIAFRLSEFFLTSLLKDPEKFIPVSAPIQESARLARFFEAPIRFHSGFFIALVMALLVYVLLFKTTWGFELRTVGANPNAARYAGMSIVASTVIAMSLSGALAGLAGANEVLGINYNLAMAFSSGYGFDAIALALIGKNHPLGVVLAALLFGFLHNGAVQMQLNAGIPVDIIFILQAFILAFIAAPAIIRTIYHLKEPDFEEEGVRLSGWGGS